MYDSCLQQNQNWLKRQSEKSNTQGKWDRISQTGGSQNTHTHKHEPGSASKQANAMLLGGAQCGDNAETWTQRCTNTNSYSTNTTCVTAGTIPYKKSSQNVLQKQDHTLKGIKTNKSQCKGVCKSSCTTWKIVKDHVVKGWKTPSPTAPQSKWKITARHRSYHFTTKERGVLLCLNTRGSLTGIALICS